MLRTARPARAIASSSTPSTCLAPHVGAHRQHALERRARPAPRRRRSAGWRDTAAGCAASGRPASGRSSMPILPASAADWIGDERRHVPDHRQRAVLRDAAGRRPSSPSPSSRPASVLAASSQASGTPSRTRLGDRPRDRSGRGRCRAAPRTGPARSGRSPPPRSGRRRRAARRDSGCARRRSRSRRSAARPRCADSRRCTSRICPTDQL